MASSISAGLSLKLSPQRITHNHTLQSPIRNPSGWSSYPSPPVHLRVQRVAREASPTTVSDSGNDVALPPKSAGLEKDPRALWKRYVDWLYQHKELGLYLDISRVGFTNEFFREMEPRFQKAFRDMQELENGSIANPDEGRMVGHYWLRNPKLAPKAILTRQIEDTLDRICDFAEQVISGKVSSIPIIFLGCCCWLSIWRRFRESRNQDMRRLGPDCYIFLQECYYNVLQQSKCHVCNDDCDRD